MGEDGEPTGLKLPYIVTIDEQSEQVLAIRRNYNEGDPYKNKINFFCSIQVFARTRLLWIRPVTHDRRYIKG
jgi:hypothetical protein